MSKQNQNAGAGQAVPPAPSNSAEPNTGTPIPVPDEIAKLDAEAAEPQPGSREVPTTPTQVETYEHDIAILKNEKAYAENEARREAERADKAESYVKSLEQSLQGAQESMRAYQGKFDELRDFLCKTASMPPESNEVDTAIELLKKQSTGTDTDKLLHVARYFVSKARYNKQLENWGAAIDPHLTMEQRLAIVKPSEIDEALAYQFPAK